MRATNTTCNPVIWKTAFKVGPKKAFLAKEVWEIRFHLKNRGLDMDNALFDLVIDPKLRGCDPMKIRIGDIAAGDEIRRRAFRTPGKGLVDLKENRQPARGPDLFCHTKIESAVRYFYVDVEDALDLAEGTDV